MKKAIGTLFTLLLVVGGILGFYAFFFLGHWWLGFLVFIVFGLGWVWEYQIDPRLERRRRIRASTQAR